jgi:hypothetical protein
VKVLVDGSEGWITPEEGAKLGHVLAALRVEAGRRRKAIAAVSLDGEELTREKQDENSHRGVEDFGVLEIRTLDPIDLSLSTLAELGTHLGKMEELHEQAAELMRGGKYDDALVRLRTCVEGWQMVLNAVRDIARLTGAKLGELKAGDKTLSHIMQYLQQTLLRFQTSFGVKDVVTLGDIAEHELAPALGDWGKALESLSEYLSEARGASE